MSIISCSAMTEEISTVNAKILKVEGRITEEVSGLRVDFTNEITKTRTELNAKMEKSKTDTIKWMFIFYIGQVAALGGILFAVLR